MDVSEAKSAKFRRIILAYPVALILIALAVNVLAFGVAPVEIELPARGIVAALVISTVLLLGNHTWLMTSTELTRLEYGLHATPEEWDASGRSRADITNEAEQELARRHNAHLNATENTVHFVGLAMAMAVVSPTILAAQIWIVGFALGRIGHTFSYLTGRDDMRGIFMSVSLLSLYGMASYLIISLMV